MLLLYVAIVANNNKIFSHVQHMVASYKNNKTILPAHCKLHSYTSVYFGIVILEAKYTSVYCGIEILGAKRVS